MSAAPSSSKEPPHRRLSPSNVAANGQVVNFIRVLVSILFGLASGILGLTHWTGLLMYFLSIATTVLLVVIKAQWATHHFFPSLVSIATGGISNSLMSFVLFWTLMYNVVHVY